MKIVKLLPQVASSLNANKLRTALTMLGIIIGVAAVIAMLAIGNGAKESIVSSIESAGTNLIYVTSYSEGGSRNLTPLTTADAEAIANSNSDSIMAVAPSVSSNYTVSYAGESASATINGVTPEYEFARNVSVAEGSFITNEQVTNRSAVAIIGVDIADDLFNSREDLIGSKLRIDDMIYTIVGVLEESGGSFLGSGDNVIYIPLTTAQSRLQSRSIVKNEVSTISVAAISSDAINGAIKDITILMRGRHKITDSDDDDFQVLSQESMTEMATSIIGVLTIFLGGIGGISLLVGGIGIMNIMLVSVIERTREIGLRKAVGARKRDILAQFLIESLTIGIAGGVLGILLGAVISSLIGKIATAASTNLNPVVSFGSILLATGFSIAVGLIFGLYPANRAANLEPVEALRSE
jgi:putative ABC transport system permease protein